MISQINYVDEQVWFIYFICFIWWVLNRHKLWNAHCCSFLQRHNCFKCLSQIQALRMHPRNLQELQVESSGNFNIYCISSYFHEASPTEKPKDYHGNVRMAPICSTSAFTVSSPPPGTFSCDDLAMKSGDCPKLWNLSCQRVLTYLYMNMYIYIYTYLCMCVYA